MGILIRNNIVNQKGNPAWYEDTLAARPIANLQGRMFVDTDVPSTGIYRDTGSTWINVADPGAGTTGTLQQVTTNGSSTNVGISVSANGIGIGTAIPGINRLDIHTGSGINATFNGTGTTNSALQFQLAGVGKWNVGNLYNTGLNDFILTDVTNSLNRITVKNTGQTFVGSDTTSSGKLVVNSSTSDSHIVVLGANGPSVRLRNTGTAPTLNVGLGISTAANNFIQGSVSGDYCIFNASTTASPILFGVYDSGSGNTIEAARISATRNFLIGSTTDGIYKLFVNGKIAASDNIRSTDGTITTILSYGTGVGSTGTISNHDYIFVRNNLEAGRFTSDNSFGVNCTPSGIGVTINAYGGAAINSNLVLEGNSGDSFISILSSATTGVGSSIFAKDGIRFALATAKDATGYSEKMRIAPTTGNVLINTTTDSGYKLYVNGNGYINGFTAFTGSFTNIGIGGGTVGQLSLTGAASDAWASSGAASLTLNGSNGYISTITTYQDDTSMRIGCGITQKTGLFINGQTASGGSYVSFTTGGSERLRIKTSGVLNISTIPTSSAGLSSGDIYSNLGILTIVP